MKEGARIYEVRERKTGKLLARGTLDECAKRIGVNRSTVLKAYNTPNHKHYDVQHIGNRRKILSVYHVEAGMISHGTIQQVASDMQRSKCSIYHWLTKGRVGDLTIEVAEKIMPPDMEIEHMDCSLSPCQHCRQPCIDTRLDCKEWRIWFSREFNAACEILRRETMKEGAAHGN